MQSRWKNCIYLLMSKIQADGSCLKHAIVMYQKIILELSLAAAGYAGTLCVSAGMAYTKPSFPFTPRVFSSIIQHAYRSIHVLDESLLSYHDHNMQVSKCGRRYFTPTPSIKMYSAASGLLIKTSLQPISAIMISNTQTQLQIHQIG